MLEEVRINIALEEMKKKGYDLEVKEVNDYKVPNKLLDKGDVDANFFQHVPYLFFLSFF
jgi:D-methionine transport system substrate-binding protein